MPKLIGRLELAHDHPGVAVLWDHAKSDPLTQFPASAVKDLLGMRKYAYWIVEIKAGCWHFGKEIPREEAEQPDVGILGQQVLPLAEIERIKAAQCK